MQSLKTRVSNLRIELLLMKNNSIDISSYEQSLTIQNNLLHNSSTLFINSSIEKELDSLTITMQKDHEKLDTFLSKQLRSTVNFLDQLLQSSSMYRYPSQSKAQKILIQGRKEISQPSDTIVIKNNILNECQSVISEMSNDIETLIHERFSILQTKMSQMTYYDIPSRPILNDFIETKGGYISGSKPGISTQIAYLKRISQLISQLEYEVEEAKKQVVIHTINSLTAEVDTMILFFSQRQGYTNELQILNDFKKRREYFSEAQIRTISSIQLQDKVNSELVAILNVPKLTEAKVKQQEKLELYKKQRQFEAEKGIPIPQVDVPKLIVVDITKQRLYAYENGLSIFDSPVSVTTGMRGFDTVKGQFQIYLKTTNFRMRSPFPGIFYDSMVKYWMPFYEGFGLHDASWRSVYGTMDYPNIGSHGCVNIPLNIVTRLYEWADVGTTVITQ
ncbi:MAG: L,D-transpeptidase [Candidatus Roizmanbacteria bacterium]